MQKLVFFENINSYDILTINNNFLDKGWIIKQIITHDRKFILLFEKETRKEKLEHLNDLELKRMTGFQDLEITDLQYYNNLTIEQSAKIALSPTCAGKSIFVIHYSYINSNYDDNIVNRRYISEGLNVIRKVKIKNLDGKSQRRGYSLL